MTFVLFFVVMVLLVRVLTLEQQHRLPPGAAAPRDAEFRRLREEVDLLTSEVRRLSDEHSFMVRLLSEGGERADRPDAPGQSPDPRPENP